MLEWPKLLGYLRLPKRYPYLNGNLNIGIYLLLSAYNPTNYSLREDIICNFLKFLRSILKCRFLCPFSPQKSHGIKGRHEGHCLPEPTSLEPRGSNSHHACCTCWQRGYLRSVLCFREGEQAQFLLQPPWLVESYHSHSSLFLSVLPPDCDYHSPSWPSFSQILRMLLLIAGLQSPITLTVLVTVFFSKWSLMTILHFFSQNLFSHLYCWCPFCSILASYQHWLPFHSSSWSLHLYFP